MTWYNYLLMIFCGAVIGWSLGVIHRHREEEEKKKESFFDYNERMWKLHNETWRKDE